VLFLVSHLCASYCRFCTRKRKVGDLGKIHPRFIEDGIDYIRGHAEIRDVVISGGDPLMLGDRKLESILKRLRAIRHVEILRLGTRMPCFLPQRITPELTAMLKKYHPLYVNVHFNHPDEITEESARALNLLADAGIPLGNQTVLLKGINDDPAVMKKLMQTLLTVRVRPYYIYQADSVKGTAHFRTPVEQGVKIMQALRGWTSGLAVPHYVIDAPGGGGKIPIVPNYIQSMSDDQVVLRNYAGELFVYPQVRQKREKKPRLVPPCYSTPAQP
jgi:lysine 2,3-aminomutase